MATKHILAGLGAAAAAVAFATVAAADIPAAAISDLNIRSGPGPEFDVVGVIPMNGAVNVVGCIEGSLWCTVSYGGIMGWSYSQYLTTSFAGAEVSFAQPPAGFVVPSVTYNAPAGTVAGLAAGAAAGAIIAGPIGAAVGGAI